MGKLKLDLDPAIDIDPVISHWCRWCERVHEFQFHKGLTVYLSTQCEGFVTPLQLCIEGRLIESKWRGIYAN